LPKIGGFIDENSVSEPSPRRKNRFFDRKTAFGTSETLDPRNPRRGAANYETFIRTLNEVIKKYSVKHHKHKHGEHGGQSGGGE